MESEIDKRDKYLNSGKSRDAESRTDLEAIREQLKTWRKQIRKSLW